MSVARSGLELSRFARTRGQARRAAAMMASVHPPQRGADGMIDTREETEKPTSGAEDEQRATPGSTRSTRTVSQAITSSYFSTSSSSTLPSKQGAARRGMKTTRREHLTLSYEEEKSEEQPVAVKEEEKEVEDAEAGNAGARSPTAKRARRTVRRRVEVKLEQEEVKKEAEQEDDGTRHRRKVQPPPHWQQVYNNIKQMRSKRDAPVDSMGCEVLADPSVDEATQRFHILVALMLSSQTKDELTSKAVRSLQAGLPGGLTPHTVLAAETRTIEKCIYGVGFWRRKAVYLKGAANMILDDFGGDIPKTIKGLVKLPGVGMKMATIAMAVANKDVSGIGVDTHVHRIANRLRWVRHTKTPEQTRVALEEWMPRDLWGEVNVLLVGFGQTICQPRQPKCSECLNRDLCPSSTAKTHRKRSAQGKDKRGGDRQHTSTVKAEMEPREEEEEEEERKEGVDESARKCRTTRGSGGNSNSNNNNNNNNSAGVRRSARRSAGKGAGNDRGAAGVSNSAAQVRGLRRSQRRRGKQ